MEAADQDGDQAITPAAPKSRLARALSGHPALSGVAITVVALGGVAAGRQIQQAVDPPYRTVAYKVPAAPRLTARTGETVLRIDPARSSASYAIDERIVGRRAGTARGTTHGVAGDVALNRGAPAKTRVGEVVINVEQLRSDSSLRDARIRSDFLQSHEYQLARFRTTKLTGLPDKVTDGTDYAVRLSGDLTVKDVTRPVTWKAEARLVDGELDLTASTAVKMSEFGVGPISIVGLVSTDDDVRLSLQLVAVDPAEHDIIAELADATTPSRTATTSGAASSVSFARQVAPILESNCASCHRSGQVGADSWTLDTAGDAAQIASGIATVSESRYMPPWPPSGVGVALQHPRGLSPSELTTLARWAQEGGPLDVSAGAPVRPRADKEPERPRHDLMLKMPTAYVGTGTEPNDYRCFLLDPKVTTPTYVTGSEFLPGTPRIVHHALIYRVAGSEHAALAGLDGADGRPGWSCGMGGGGAGAGAESVGGRRALFSGWVPGQRPHSSGKNMGYLFRPGDLIVMQVHYHYGKAVLSDQSTLALQTQAPTSDMHELVTVTPVAPVELPCPATAKGPLCDRAASIADGARRYGPQAALFPEMLRNKCGAQNVTSDPVTGNGTSRCDWRVGLNGDIVDVLGHMHTRGKTFRMILDPGTPKEKVLLDIPHWNFDWQINYQPVTPVPVVRGDTIRIECSWDRAQRYDPAPRYITFAEGTEDEMCFSTYTVDPTLPGPVGRKRS